MDKKQAGLINKFTVYRNDGKDKPGGPKENAQYFVLDYVNDPLARFALLRYASVCEHDYPELAKDIRDKLNETHPNQ